MGSSHLAVRAASVAVAAVLTVVATGCGAAVPDYEAIWSTTPSPTETTTNGEKPVSIADYLQTVGVDGNPVAPDKVTGLKLTVPTPDGWKPYVNANLAPGTRTIAKGDTYPTAMLVVFQLSGDFDIAKAMKHADGDAELSKDFKKLNGSDKDFGGFPSSMIEGTYDLNGKRMQTYNRIVIATGKPLRPNLPGQRYLVQLTLTTFADEARQQGPDIEKIIKGFTVKAA